MTLESEAFEVLAESLAALRPDVVARDAILCPLCLREIPRARLLERGIEHIIPRSVLKQDSADIATLGTRNQRAGITVLCRDERVIASTGKFAKDGCNGFKGSTYDWSMRHLLDKEPHSRGQLAHRHGVAILVMAYLGAFQCFGYDYILRPELDEIRKQFDYPDVRVTDWLDHALYRLQPLQAQVTATERGMPFLFGGVLNPSSPLHVIFRRCQALLPQGHWTSHGVRSLHSLIPPDVE